MSTGASLVERQLNTACAAIDAQLIEGWQSIVVVFSAESPPQVLVSSRATLEQIVPIFERFLTTRGVPAP